VRCGLLMYGGKAAVSRTTSMVQERTEPMTTGSQPPSGSFSRFAEKNNRSMQTKKKTGTRFHLQAGEEHRHRKIAA
jgi:hypothetical protein